MRTKLLVFAVLLSAVVSAQVFNGIEVGRSLTYTRQLLASKNFVRVQGLNDKDLETYRGQFNGEKVDITLVKTNKNLVRKLILMLPYNYSWYDAKTEYQKYKDILYNKYEKVAEYEFFKEPYFDGDGYELSAIVNENGFYETFFKDANDNSIRVLISAESNKKAQVWVSYENEKVTAAWREEKERINTKSF